tara:strand:- start:665 stop:1318 length:654 start_codon:yes stop_codon:yes gene_type:complete
MSKLNKTELYALAKQLVSDNNSLKEENEKLDIKLKSCFGIHKQYKDIKEENENLKHKYGGFDAERLKEDNEKLEEEVSKKTYEIQHWKISYNKLKEQKDHKRTLLEKEIEKLKKEDWSKKYALKIDYQRILDDNKKLKEENEKLKETKNLLSETLKEHRDYCSGNIKWRDEVIKKLKEENSRFQQLKKNYNELLVLGSKFNDYASGLTGTVSQNSTN